MLVLSRKKNEKIIINNDIEVVVVEIRGDKVHLGITAPAAVPVHREEVYKAIHRASLKSSNETMRTLPLSGQEEKPLSQSSEEKEVA